MTLTQGAVPQWRDISTAPKDGTLILVWTHHGEIEVSSWFQYEGESFEPAENGLYRKVRRIQAEGWNGNTPTHWMPLPPPPEQP